MPAASAPSCTLPDVSVALVRSGASSVMVTLRSPDASVTALPSKSTASTKCERSIVSDPLWSIGASSLKVHDPLSLSVSVNTSVPLVEPPV